MIPEELVIFILLPKTIEVDAMAACLPNASGGLIVKGEGGAIHDNLILLHQFHCLFLVVHIDFLKIDPGVVEPFHHFSASLLI